VEYFYLNSQYSVYSINTIFFFCSFS